MSNFMKIKEYQPTPNPNALKLVMEAAVTSKPRSYLKAEEAADDAIASALFAVPGVTSLLFLGDFVTINRSPETPWADIKKAAAKVLLKLTIR